MKYYTFFRENNVFTDIENDLIIKRFADTKIKWYQHYMVGISSYIKDSDQYYSILTLKYGDDMIQSVCKDYSPVPGVDYVPKRDASKYKKTSE
jgi:hypothetical protein